MTRSKAACHRRAGHRYVRQMHGIEAAPKQGDATVGFHPGLREQIPAKTAFRLGLGRSAVLALAGSGW